MPEIVKKISDFQDKSLLIVDDDGPFRDRLARSMEKKGFKVTQAESVNSSYAAMYWPWLQVTDPDTSGNNVMIKHKRIYHKKKFTQFHVIK